MDFNITALHSAFSTNQNFVRELLGLGMTSSCQKEWVNVKIFLGNFAWGCNKTVFSGNLFLNRRKT